MKAILILFLFSSSLSFGQQSVLEYKILHKGDIIGSMKLLSKKEGPDLSIKMSSNVEVRFILSTVIKMHEESLFQNGRLIFSDSKRTVNGKMKLNNQTKAAEKFYYVTNKGKTTTKQVENIDYNLLMLYIKEPDDLKEVYSDSFHEFIKIEKLAAHHYKLILPNKDYNEYFFKNGVCNRVVVNSMLFKIEMVLTN